ncbi:MAG: class II fructose-bisphosphate aldolase [Patescibacteria group bacterium]|nr:class II fructose-bisphosphate aldolase family protein [Patescibacteria group bacterium]MBU1160542.1 class II fructose-bisphosphate aldolase family protein [Patescibacteria group bacterium]MBU1349850.1 class II fructose-bisphosphate aldolase family protein [Patescibacteria group bacterium]MBU1421540.1 class II fructose-bisphosphate aldolase family protein [Patescibacteria group bacterium]MBU1778638.1 class II fructose-bisphosphate aldolase family protein [Patescibacteria group bacterium]
MLVHIKDIIKNAKKDNYAVGAFNVHNLESILGVAQAVIKVKSPVIIQVSESTINYLGLKPITHIVSTVAKNIAAQVPVALHLDHGKNFDVIFECINAGFTSIHIDASHLPLDENINLTKQIVEIAHAKGIWVQGEVGAIIGGHGSASKKIKNIPLANVDEVVQFVQATNVDTIAAAIGTAHGIYENEDIKINLLKQIKSKIKKPFVLHGGSGIKDAKIKKAIKEGVNIINIGSDIKIAFCSALIKNCVKNKKETDPRILLKPTILAVEKVVINKTKLFGSAGRAT